ncbi:MAG: YD repeat-/RHS repeat-containing protein, partial [bacterium]
RPQELEVSPDSRFLFIGSRDTVSIVETRLFQVVSRFKVTNSGFGDLLLKVSFDGRFLYVAEYLGTDVFIYDTKNNTTNKMIVSRGQGIISNLSISSDGRLLYISRFYSISTLNTENNSFVTTIVTSTGTGFPNPFGGSVALVGDFSVGQAPTLQTLLPITSQQVIAGQPVTVKWQTTVAVQSYSIASHRVELSTDSGVTFTAISGAEMLAAEAQEFTWQVPDVELLDKVQIRVSTVDLGARRANSTTGNFSIIKTAPGDTQAPTVTFLSPKGSERFISGNNLQISWMSSDNVAVTSQDLSLSIDGGATFPITIASGLPGTTQSFSFPIPMTLQTEQARLRLIVRDAAGNSSQTVTPSNFGIELGADTIVPTVTISQPSSNQSLIAGQSIQVKWQSVDNRAVANQALLLSLDGGKTFATVATFGASDNSFVIKNIEELNITNSQGIVRITATDSSGNIGQA